MLFNCSCVPLLLVLFFSYFLTEARITVFVMEECLRETNTPWTSSQISTKVANQRLLCLHKCIYKKSGIIDDKGNFLINSIREEMTNSTLNDNYKEELFDCLELIEKITNCDDIRLINNCFGNGVIINKRNY
ncbi:unnamed protein product [Brassicogethes aeneus]|uniref:Uncharacterized protein n=1 Tax=Brassicogethes aeneus TaxID=1431903 RepID=A0A9P0FH04_BRAAE|nr:unnamed protein product [Brassicogethes aeneus]